MRCIYQGQIKDHNGWLLPNAVVNVFLSGTTTPASIYTTLASTTAVNSVTSSSTDATIIFYVDRFDYDQEQTFDFVISKTTSQNVSFNNLTISGVDVSSVVTGTYVIATDKTVNTHLVISRGVMYQINTGVTLTLNVQPDAGGYQIFNLVGTGTIAGTAILAPWWVGTGTAAVTQMQVTSAPYPASVATPPTSQENEIQQLKYVLAQAIGNPYWYQTPYPCVNYALYDANTILAATTDNTPAALTISQQTIVGRKTGGNIAALSGPDVLSITGINQLMSISASVALNALTLGYAGGTMDFRSATLTNGTPISAVAISSLSLVVPSGATLGSVNAVQSILALVVLYNGGTPALGIVNMSGGVNLDETTLLSTTAIDTASDLATVVYSTNAITSSPFRVVGYIMITEATAGTWATAPTLVQGYGGQAMATMQSLGMGQTWQDVLTSPGRVVGTTYYNTTGRPIVVVVAGSVTSTYGGVGLIVNGMSAVVQQSTAGGNTDHHLVEMIIPPGGSYIASLSGSESLEGWIELR